MDYFRMTQNKQIIHNKKHEFPRLTKVQYYLRNRRLTNTTSRIYYTEIGASIVYKAKAEDNIINDYMNMYMYNYPEDYSQTALQFTGQSYYLTVVHTTDKLLEQVQQDLKRRTETATGINAKTWTGSSRSRENELDAKDNGRQS
eukprot:971910-Amphidinium_carterae.2